MDTKNPRARGARASKSIAADKKLSTPNHPQNQPRRVGAAIIRNTVWGKVAVSIDPPSISNQPRYFRHHAEALDHAREMAKLHDLLLIDLAREGDE